MTVQRESIFFARQKSFAFKRDPCYTHTNGLRKGRFEMPTLAKSFVNRVINERVVDTKRHRYVSIVKRDETSEWFEIRRMPLKNMDASKPYEDWELVKIVN